MRQLFRRLWYLARQRQRGDDLAEELAFHLAARQAELERDGAAPGEAALAARRAMGNTTLAREDAQALWVWPWLEQAVQDVRFGARTLARSPGFALVALLTLALGIGANAAIFSLVNAIFLKPLPVASPRELVGVSQDPEERASFADYQYYREHNTSFSDLAAFAPVYLADGTDARELDGYLVSGNYFDVLGVKPVAGRVFFASEDRVPGRDAVAVLGHGFWRRRFNADPGIIGRPITLNGLVFTIVGVLPEEFRAPQFGRTPVEVWIPSMMNDLATPGTQDNFDIVGRLEPGQTLETARADLSVLAAQLDASQPLQEQKRRALQFWPAVGPPTGWAADGWGQLARLLMAGVSCLLLIACTNLAGLLLARGLSRQREIAVRLAIGASGGRLVRQVLTESLLLSILAAAPGVVIAWWLAGMLGGFYGTEVEGNTPYFDVSLDHRVLAYTLGLAVVTGLVFGLLPALQARRTDFMAALKTTSAGSGQRRSRVRAVLLAGQVALCVVLVVNTGLLLQSLSTVIRPGFEPERVAFLRTKTHLVGYDREKSERYYREITRRLEALPGVEVVSFAAYPPVADWCCEDDFSRPGREAGRPADAVNAMWNRVTPSFFQALGIRFIAGRGFEERDRLAGRRVAVVNEAMAQRLWPGQSAVGMTMSVDGRDVEVVGVVRYVNYERSDGQRRFFVFFPATDTPNRMFVRVAGDPRTMLPMLRAAITGTDPAVPISEELALSDMIGNFFMPVRLGSVILSYASALALLLSALGVYGVLAFSVRQRAREIGIRIALGARRGDIIARVLGDGLVVVAAGSTAGLIGALMSGRLVTSFLYGVHATDWTTLAGGPIVLVLVGMLASYLPARKAAGVSPLEAARSE